MDFPMQGACAAISCLLATLALSGDMRTTSPVASIQPRSDLNSVAYGDSVQVGERWF
jgi:hypothetical protein